VTAVLAVAAVALPGAVRARGGDTGWLLFLEAGGEVLGRDGFAVFEPGLEYRGDELAVALGKPLRIRGATTDGVPHAAMRRADVDELSDVGGMVRLVSWGEEGDRFHLVAGSLPSFTLGSGAVVGGLRPSLDPDHPRGGAFAHLDLGPVILEGLASDLLSPRVFAGRAAIPFGRRLLVGGTYAVEPEPIPGAGAVTVLGADASLVLVRGEVVALAPYAEAAGLLDGGAGLHLGLATDFRFGPGGDAVLGLRAEWRAMERGYLPRYFDEFHEVERWSHPRITSPPKHVWVRGAPGGQGFATEVRLELPPGLAALVAVEGGGRRPWSAAVGADFRPDSGWSLGLLFARRGAVDAGDVLDLSGEKWAMAEARVNVGGPFYAVGTYARGFRTPREQVVPRGYVSASLGLGAAIAP
jgi:hypothetical protein